MHEPVAPELYLRRLAERALLDAEQRRPWGGLVEQVGSALVAVGMLAEPVAVAVADSYALAGEVRGRGGPPHRARHPKPQPSSSASADLQASRIVPGPMEVPLSWGEPDLTVRWVRFGAEETAIAVRGRLAASPRPRHQPHSLGPAVSAPAAARPPGLVVADDQGLQVVASFNGGWGGKHVEGTFIVRPPLSGATQWIELDGQRVTLSERRTPNVHVAMEALAMPSRAVAYLWHELAVSDGPFPGPSGDPGAIIEALLAVGAIDASDPQLQAIGRVAATRSGRAGVGTGSGGEVPEPWASLLAARARVVDGATAVVPVGVVTPPVDGVVVAVHALEAEPQGFGLEVETAPGWGLHRRFTEPGRSALAWWVEDDRGGVHLGHVGNSGGSPDRMTGTVQFTGGLDPAARELRIVVTGLTERAVITVEDPWGASQPEPADVR